MSVTEEVVIRFRTNFKQFRDGMNQAGDVLNAHTNKWKNLGALLPTIGRKVLKVGQAFKKVGMEAKKVQMNLLGLGFFGMAVKNFFSGLLRPAMEAVGLFDLFGATLQVVFLPIVMALLDLLLPVFEWLMNLSDATKLLIGKWVLFGLGAGFVLMVVGFLLSGLASLIFIFGGLFALLKAIIPEIILFGVNISSIIETLLGIAIVKTVWDFFSNIIGKLWEQFKKLDFVKETMAQIKGVTERNIPIFDKLTAKADGLFKQFKDKIPTFEELKVKTKEWMTEFKLDKLLEDLKSLAHSLGVIADLIINIGKFFGWIGKNLRDNLNSNSNGTPLFDMWNRTVYKTPTPVSGPVQGPIQINNNVDIKASSNVDIEMAKNQLSTQWSADFNRLTS